MLDRKYTTVEKGVVFLLLLVTALGLAVVLYWCQPTADQDELRRLNNVSERLDKEMDVVKKRLDSCRCTDGKR